MGPCVCVLRKCRSTADESNERLLSLPILRRMGEDDATRYAGYKKRWDDVALLSVINTTFYRQTVVEVVVSDKVVLPIAYCVCLLLSRVVDSRIAPVVAFLWEGESTPK